ncbi:glycosyltransferase family 4 protein [Niabella aquatica]
MSLNHPKNSIAIISCCPDDWGGSEDLWCQAALVLKTKGYRITAYKQNFNPQHPEVKRLQDAGIHLVGLHKNTSLTKRTFKKVYKKLFASRINQLYAHGTYSLALRQQLKKDRPQFVVINQGMNFDGLSYAYQCLLLHIPYSLVMHKAVEFYWPPSSERTLMKEIYQNAKQCYFVSHHNKKLTEEQFGFRFMNAQVIWNPIKLKREPIPYPQQSEVYKLACIGRLFIIDKGQDILLRILSKEPWCSRPVQVSFIGSGTDEEGLKSMAALLNVKNASFSGYHNSIEDLWKNYHALILPSRSEGMPLTVIEAMLAGRTVITTHAGGNSEIIEDGVTGFIGEATEKDFEQKMEEAWTSREQWEQIGLKACTSINKILPEAPEEIFAALIIKNLI